MKFDPTIHIIIYSVLSLKSGVTRFQEMEGEYWSGGGRLVHDAYFEDFARPRARPSLENFSCFTLLLDVPSQFEV